MNLFENDTITVTGKKQASEHIIGRYENFGWQLTEKKEDKRYDDTVHMTFTRPHSIENKDKLQLLQVRLEIAYNNTGKLAQKIGSQATLIASLFALVAIAFIAGGVYLILTRGLLPIIFGAVACAGGAFFATVGGVLAARVYKKDKQKYTRLIENEVQKIEDLCAQAKQLRGANE
ncbi:MAG: hypothetical protein K2N23_07480 [Clostridia bacterium]|nr:hypothetical protein [Clostridia bacterium]